MTLATLWRWRAALMATGVGMLAALLRLGSLSQPHALVFDEVFYARGAYSLTVLGFEGDWTGDDSAFVDGDYSGLTTEGDFVVHPMVGKLLIALGIELVGVTPVGWRIVGAVLGVALAVMVALIARRLFRSTVWGAVAGILIAVDGEAIVLARTALLDGFLAFFVVAGFGLLVIDRDRTRALLEREAAADRAALGMGPEGFLPGGGPRTGIRWWRLAAIVAFALAASTKWSGLYFAAAFLVLSVVWDAVARRELGYDRWLAGAFVRAVPAAVATVVTTLVVYVASWANWFLTDGSYARRWAEEHPGEGATWLPDALNSLLHYHQQMWTFHTGLTTEHNYMSNPWLWLIQWRPTAFYFEDVPDADCGAERCVSAIHALGNPLIWWLATAALVWALWRVLRHRDMLALTVSMGVLAGWVPWLPYAYRTIFTFYSVAFAPFMVLTLVWALRRIAQPERLAGAWSRRGVLIVGITLAAILVVAAFFVPLWVGSPVPFRYWQLHMWLPTWV
ncbi:dolichyl-phosphate-mannose--protein mannosyltransferase [Demequina lignilytica]|uniref:Polyprenol-phosphate-mannose--protein mannosyltransferase n=1 Tax=Demequina lignilytica TaxID=3051663 RepID=A0AB35MIG4_9MICO|nr:phospholipid carrier-dependent glycosyltransferase [Demequina sp. SYSU T0a273]MDN4483612.1 phospholipid carrier-dependent glycosyltransferase [Demequina sp. SYSU T0a273]